MEKHGNVVREIVCRALMCIEYIPGHFILSWEQPWEQEYEEKDGNVHYEWDAMKTFSVTKVDSPWKPLRRKITVYEPIRNLWTPGCYLSLGKKTKIRSLWLSINNSFYGKNRPLGTLFNTHKFPKNLIFIIIRHLTIKDSQNMKKKIIKAVYANVKK